MKTMLDTVTPGVLRGTPLADVYAGYVGGHFADYDAITHDFPGHLFVSIAVFPGEVADFCDCEGGDFTPAQVLPWIREMHAKGVWRPGVYANASTLPSILPGLARALPRASYRVWGASWNGRADLPAGWDAHQYIDHGPHGENYDMSVVANDFFPTHRPPMPPHHHHLARARVVLPAIEFDTIRHDWRVVTPAEVLPMPWGDQ